MAKNKDRWVPLVRANVVKDASEELIQAYMVDLEMTREEALARQQEELSRYEYWMNDIYQVQLSPTPNPLMIQMNIRRRDGKPIFRDWRHFQRIKNQLIGEECEAVELYPAESRLTDTSNKYHLWCIKDPEYRFPFGFPHRDVRDDEGISQPGLRQRPL